MGLRFLSDISDKNLDLYYSGLSRNLHNLTFVFRFVTIKVGNSLEAPSLKKNLRREPHLLLILLQLRHIKKGGLYVLDCRYRHTERGISVG